jgi:ADP-heptose:LPS heptosyltransferase
MLGRAAAVGAPALSHRPGLHGDLNFDLARRVTGRPNLPLARVPLGYDPQDAETVERHLHALGVDPLLPFVVLHPFASLPYKEWGLGKFLELARCVTEEFDLPVDITSEKKDPALDWPRRIWGLSIPQLAALIEQAALFIGNNSGPMNVVGAMGTPTLIVEGPSPRGTGVPWTDAPAPGDLRQNARLHPARAPRAHS